MSLFCNDTQLDIYRESKIVKSINEAYFGRTPGIMRCFYALCDFRHKYIGKGVLNSISHIGTDHDPDLTRFIHEMEREFGLESFSIIISNSPSVDACTYPVLFSSSNIDPKRAIVISKTGYKFKPEVKMSIIMLVYTGLLFNEEYTDEEVFAIILHEIGHNFEEYLNGNIHSFNNVNRVLFFIYLLIDISAGKILTSASEILISTGPTHRAFSKMYNELSEKDKNNLYSYYNFVQGILKLPKNIVKSVMAIPTLPLKLIIVSGEMMMLALVQPTRSIQMYLGEKMADNFTSYYGFGEAQATVLDKMDKTVYGNIVQLIQDCPLIGHIYNFAILPGDILFTLADEHPAVPVRQKEILNSMKYDLKDPNLSPKLKKQLKKEIDQYEKTVSDIYEKNSKISNPRFFKYIIDNLIYKSKSGGIKSGVNNLIFGDTAKEVGKRTDIIRNTNII